MTITRFALLSVTTLVSCTIVCVASIDTLPVSQREGKQIDFIQKLREQRHDERRRSLQIKLDLLEAESYSADMADYDDDLVNTIVNARKNVYKGKTKKGDSSTIGQILGDVLSNKKNKAAKIDKKSKDDCPGKGKGQCYASDFPSYSPSPTTTTSPMPSISSSPTPSLSPSKASKGKGMGMGKGGMGMGKGGMGMGMMGMGKGDIFPTVSPSASESPIPTLSLSPIPTMSVLPTFSIAPSESKGKGKMAMGMDKGMMVKKCKDDKKMGMGKGKGKGGDVEDCTDAPSNSPTSSAIPSISTFPTLSTSPTGVTLEPTIIPTSNPTLNNPTAAPALTPTISPNCEPTSGQCVDNLASLQLELESADVGDVVGMCDGTVVSTDIPVNITQSQITLCCVGTDCTILGSGSDSVLVATGPSVTLQDLRFEDGISTQFNGGNVAIEADGDHVIRGCEFVNGETSDIGGNLFVITTGTLTIEETIFQDGTAALAGGGVAVLDAAQVTVRNSEFIGNDSSEGGGFYSYLDSAVVNQSQEIVIENTSFTQNSADLGAGFLVSALGDLPSLSILTNVFTDNAAAEAGGAGAILVNLDTLSLTLNGNTGSGNTGNLVCPEFLTVTSTSNDPLCVAVDASI